MLSIKACQRLVTALLLLWSVDSLAWWNDAWSYRLPVSVDTSATSGAGIADTHGEATVLVKLHSGNFNDFFLVNENLSDIRFIGGDDKTPLKHHVEYFDLINQLAYIWVKVPEVTGGISTGKLWMYYGNATATGTADTGASYDKNTAAVFHFNDATGVPQDSSAYQGHAGSFTGVAESTGVIAGDIRLANGTNMIVNDSPALAVTAESGMTFSFWMKSDQSQNDGWLLHRSDGANELVLGVKEHSLYARLRMGGQEFETPAVAAITPNNWQHIALIISADRMVLMVDGNEVSNVAIALQPFAGTLAVGSSLEGGNGFSGFLDELRIDNVARSSDWLKLALSSQGLNNRLLAYQPAEQLGSGGDNSSTFFTVIFTSTEASGWTVIALLGAMAFMSWIVMIGKVLFLRSVRKDNINFMSQYEQLGDNDPGMLDVAESDDEKGMHESPITQAIFGDHDHFQSSPLYRVYHRGIEEVHSRLGKTVGAQATALSSGAVSAIKAAINSQMVREVQRLNGQMVLLTIAISGGPFLGLFGTVLGVMITFAAIAATGDVNIAAIAPGVAAALLTTIVGLIVAIPAMFAYNWLQTRIKATIVEMRVFSDQFITRIDEYYGDSN